jgi:hypothetical protein
MSVTNDAFRYNLAQVGFTEYDGLTCNNTTQATATALISEINRVIIAVNNGTCVLKSVLSNEAPPICVVFNDSGQTIKAFCFTGENMNGSLNGFVSIANGAFGLFSKVPPLLQKSGGGGGTLDWRGAAIS